MNSNGINSNVSCQVLLNVSIIVRLCKYHRDDLMMRFYEELVSDISDIFPFPKFSKVVFAILTPRSLLVFLIFRPFPEHLACFSQDGHTGWPVVIVICRKK